MIELDVQVEIEGEKAADAAGARRRLDDLPGAIAEALVDQLVERVAVNGEPADHFGGYSDAEVGRAVSPDYPARGGRVTKSGSRWWPSSAGFRRDQGAREGSFAVSAAMWDGLQPSAAGGEARAEFVGSSEGQGYAVVGGRAEGRRVSNAEKAETILEETGVNVLALTEDEFEDLGDAATRAARESVEDMLSATPEWSGEDGRDSGLSREILRRLRIGE